MLSALPITYPVAASVGTYDQVAAMDPKEPMPVTIAPVRDLIVSGEAFDRAQPSVQGPYMYPPPVPINRAKNRTFAYVSLPVLGTEIRSMSGVN